mmetsp:Transcript_32962/g.71856  ORF Transcript_32962/g.71856 Transcript_32962/m.71856 type:complete len:322 (-) Transcript_32962:169-1134(-)
MKKSTSSQLLPSVVGASSTRKHNFNSRVIQVVTTPTSWLSLALIAAAVFNYFLRHDATIYQQSALHQNFDQDTRMRAMRPSKREEHRERRGEPIEKERSTNLDSQFTPLKVGNRSGVVTNDTQKGPLLGREVDHAKAASNPVTVATTTTTTTTTKITTTTVANSVTTASTNVQSDARKEHRAEIDDETSNLLKRIRLHRAGFVFHGRNKVTETATGMQWERLGNQWLMVDPEDIRRQHEVEEEKDQSLLKFRTFGKWEQEQKQLEARRRERERQREQAEAEEEAKKIELEKQRAERDAQRAKLHRGGHSSFKIENNVPRTM